ncbi:hypothetical protein TeGR_g2254 [Tetraparma gracilis]|uniref:E3 ubiquitin-protein ligase synoviolin-like TPR repeats domain-containing protein n=1 Tax=Tetraparma gracilis TaxID=2962635 RepID=A0ABQ6MQD6_9STRA|nr:hypothetical protein TeGR_g2254 [Tetraparma gracilis]
MVDEPAGLGPGAGPEQLLDGGQAEEQPPPGALPDDPPLAPDDPLPAANGEAAPPNPPAPNPPPPNPPAPPRSFGVSFGLYSLLAFALPLAYLWYASTLHRHNFFLTVSYAAAGKVMPVLLGNLSVVLSVQLFKLAIAAFFSRPLSSSESDDISDHVKYSLTELCLALNIFRSSLTASTVCFFLLLVLLKALGAAAQTRLALIPTYTDQAHRHTGLVALLLLLLALASSLAVHHATTLRAAGASSHILFLFETCILCATAMVLIVRYFLHRYSSPDSSFTSYATLGLAVAHASVKLTGYLMLFCCIFHYFGLPLNTLRALYVSYGNLDEAIQK